MDTMYLLIRSIAFGVVMGLVFALGKYYNYTMLNSFVFGIIAAFFMSIYNVVLEAILIHYKNKKRNK